MKRSTQINRGPAPKRYTPVKKRRSKPRRVSVDRNPKYRKWIAAHLGCAVQPMEYMLRDMDYLGCSPPYDAAHTQNNGLSSKGPDSKCVCLCRMHHDQYDGRSPIPGESERGKKAFERHYRIDMSREADTQFFVYRMMNNLDSASDTDIQ